MILGWRQQSLNLNTYYTIFIIWNQGEEKLLEFIKFFNEANPTITFRSEYSKEEVTFLDIRVKIDIIHKTVYTDLYTKDTDTHNYLHYTSAHPAHFKKGGPFGEFLRIRRNCHKLTDFEEHAYARMSDYLRRGYQKEDLEKALDKARKLIEILHSVQKNILKLKKEEFPSFSLSIQPFRTWTLSSTSIGTL